MKNATKNLVCRIAGLFTGKTATIAGASAVATVAANAQTDITGVLTQVQTYETSAIAIGIAVLLWVVGRMIVHKMTRG